MRYQGIVESWKDERGFGIVRITFKQRFFLHVSQWQHDEAPFHGQSVSFETADPRPGGALPQAIDVRPEPQIVAKATEGGAQ